MGICGFLSGITFLTWRFFEICTLIPVLGMLSWFVHGFTQANQLTPTAILVLFIVSVLACFWAVGTLLGWGSTKWNAQFCAFIDLCFMGALIAGVYYLRGIARADCANWAPSYDSGSASLGGLISFSATVYNPFSVNLNKSCAMLKASFAFGIMNVLFFFVTFLVLLWVSRDHVNDPYYRGGRGATTRTSYSRSHHSRSPRRSHHSQRSYRRTYV